MCPFCGLALYSRHESHGDHWVADCCQWGAMLASGVELKAILLAAEAASVESDEEVEEVAY